MTAALCAAVFVGDLMSKALYFSEEVTKEFGLSTFATNAKKGGEEVGEAGFDFGEGSDRDAGVCLVCRPRLG